MGNEKTAYHAHEILQNKNGMLWKWVEGGGGGGGRGVAVTGSIGDDKCTT